jgi:hypothetical protein
VACHQPSKTHHQLRACAPTKPRSIATSQSSAIHPPTCHPALLSHLISEVWGPHSPTVPPAPSEPAESSALGTVVTKVSVAWNNRDKYIRKDLTSSSLVSTGIPAEPSSVLTSFHRFHQLHHWYTPVIRYTQSTRFHPIRRLCHCQQFSNKHHGHLASRFLALEGRAPRQRASGHDSTCRYVLTLHHPKVPTASNTNERKQTMNSTAQQPAQQSTTTTTSAWFLRLHQARPIL